MTIYIKIKEKPSFHSQTPHSTGSNAFRTNFTTNKIIYFLFVRAFCTTENWEESVRLARHYNQNSERIFGTFARRRKKTEVE